MRPVAIGVEPRSIVLLIVVDNIRTVDVGLAAVVRVPGNSVQSQTIP